MLATGAWLSRERVTAFALISAVAAIALTALVLLTAHGTVDSSGRPVGTDFSAFWTAGQLANAGRASDAWNIAIHTAAARATHHSPGLAPTPWVYPPVFLLVTSGFARLPYLPALFLWQAVSVLLVAGALSLILDERRALLVALASPFTMTVLVNGQNSYLTAALLGGGVALRKHPGPAGALLGGLVYKPQLGLLLGPFLLLQRQWWSLVAMGLSALALIGLSLLLWGWEPWTAFFAALGFARSEILEAGAVPFFKTGSIFGAIRLWGLSTPVAYTVQAIGSLFALLVLWWSRHAPERIRAASLCAAVALWTPYVQDYDLAILGIGGAFFYAEAAERGFLRWEKSALALIWIQPLFARFLAQQLHAPTGPVATLLLAWLVLRRAEPVTTPSLSCR